MTSIRLPYVQEYRDRHGKARRYFRRPGFKRVTLPGTPGSPQFMDAYETALSAEPPPTKRSTRHKDGSIGDLVTGFYRSPYFENLKPSSQRLYRLVLDKFADEDGHRLVRDMPRRVAMDMIEKIGAAKPGMANLTLKAMRRAFAYAVKKDMRADNPFVGIESYKLGTHHTWTDAEIAAYEAVWPIGTRERLALDLLLYTGQRVGDVAAMKRSDLRNSAIYIKAEKTGDELVIPLHPNLLRSMKACPAKGLTLFGQTNGRPITGTGLSSVIQRAARIAGLEAKCVPHGLRKARMRRLAERGATTKEIASISGHKTLKEVERYTVAADQERLARNAMAREEQNDSDEVSNLAAGMSNRNVST
jgi:enterobacteria phage integrase